MKNDPIGMDEEELAKYFHHLTKYLDKEKEKEKYSKEETENSEEDTEFECVD